jgi:hypothetical protein
MYDSEVYSCCILFLIVVEILSFNSFPVAFITTSLSRFIVVFGEDCKSFVEFWKDSKSFEIAVENVEKIIKGEKIKGNVREIVEDGRTGESAGEAKKRVEEIVEGGKIEESAEKSEEIVGNRKMEEFAARMNFFFNFAIFVFAFRNTFIFSSYVVFSTSKRTDKIFGNWICVCAYAKPGRLKRNTKQITIRKMVLTKISYFKYGQKGHLKKDCSKRKF